MYIAMLALLVGHVAYAAQVATKTAGEAFIYPMHESAMDPNTFLDSKQKALSLMQASRWQDAEVVLESVVKSYPYDGGLWRDLGTARAHLGQNQKAAAAFVQADCYGLSAGADYNAADAARAFARSGDSRAAVHWLEIALGKYTYRDPEKLLAEPTFDELRSLAEFRSLTPPKALIGSGSREAKLSADLDFYLQEYAKYRFSRLTHDQVEDVLEAASALRKRLSTLSDDEVVVEFQRLSAAAAGGHNYTTFGTGVGGKVMLSLPIDMYLFPEGLFVIGAEDHRYDRLVGARVTAFGLIPTEEMLRRVAPLIDRDSHADSNVVWHAPEYLNQLSVLHDLGATSSATSIQLTLLANGHEATVSMDGAAHRKSPKLYPSRLSSADAPLALGRVGDNYWYTDLSAQTVYVQFNQVINKAGESLMDFGVRLRRHLQEQGTRNLIVDARFNGGGNTFEYLELLRTLIAFDAQDAHQLFYVEGRATFSAAVNFTTEVRTLTHAIFVGEPASAPRAEGDPVSITLPNTKIEVRFSTDTWSLYYPDDTRCWIAPDLPVTLTAKDYFANKDPVLHTIEEAIARRQGMASP